jgi:hypothetical protein
VYGVLARPRCRRRNQLRVQPWLAVVQHSLRNDADQRVLIEIDRIVARRRYITARPASPSLSRRKKNPRLPARKERMGRRELPTSGHVV